MASDEKTRVRELEESLADAADALTDARNGLDFGLAAARAADDYWGSNDHGTDRCHQIASHLERARAADRNARATLESPRQEN